MIPRTAPLSTVAAATPTPAPRARVRAVVVRGVVLALLGPLLLGVATAAPAAADTPAPTSFGEPSMQDRPMYRFWWTGGLLTRESAMRQAQQMRRLGAGGFEVNQFVLLTPGYQALLHDWSNASWGRAFTDLHDAGARQGMRVDHIYTPGWSAGTTTVSADGPGSAKHITFGSARVLAGGTYVGPVPRSLPSPGATRMDLQGAVAYRCAVQCLEPVPLLVGESAVDLTDRVRAGGLLTWTAPASPAGSSWLLVGAHSSGTGQTVVIAGSKTPSLLVDHFDRSGLGAVRSYWEKTVEPQAPRLEGAVRRAKGSMFFDSLELNDAGAQVRHWTGDYLREFERRRGYSLRPYIAAVAVSDPVFEFTGGLGERIREDYNQTLSDLFRDEHLEPLMSWAHGRGLTVRGQPYSSFGPSPLDVSEMAQVIDIAEGEDRSFESGQELNYIETRGSDVWRAMASAVAQGGKKLVSTECCAEGQTYAVPRRTLLSHIHKQVASGVNHFVWHGWADRTPGASPLWPGNAPFGPLVADVYGPHLPTAEDDARLNDYVGRLQTVMRRGSLRHDVAIYRQGRGHSASGEFGELYFRDQSLARAGYTYGFMNRTLLAADNARVRRGVLSAGGIGYKAFVLNSTANPNNEAALDLASARRILSYARAGLPVVVVGRTPTRVRGFHPRQDAALRKTLAELVGSPRTRVVGSERQVLGALRAVGVRPAARFARPSPLLGIRRSTKDTDYYFFYNASPRRQTVPVTLAGRGRPFRYDANTGAVKPVLPYRTGRGGVTTTISAASGDGVLLAVTRGNAETARLAAPRVHPVSTTATAILAAKGRSILVAERAGRYRTRLSNGQTVVRRISKVPAPIRLGSWRLQVTAWDRALDPNGVNRRQRGPFTITTDGAGTLPDWLRIPGLQATSGVGTYSTHVTVPRRWSGGRRAFLDLGRVDGNYTVSVNGRPLSRQNQVDPTRIDLGSALRPGTNRVEVEVATLLGNAAYAPTASYGLLGPLTLRPVGTARLPRGR